MTRGATHCRAFGPDDSGAYCSPNTLSGYYDRDDLAKAGPEVGQAIRLKPDFAEAHLLAGNILLRARQPENALQMFEQYLRLEPSGAFAAQARELVARIKQALGENKPHR